MIDSDLAQLYGVETRRLNEQVKRNIDRFPEDFMFQLTKSETEDLRLQVAHSNSRSQDVILNERELKSQNMTPVSRSQNAILKQKQGHNIKYLPYAFTENGVAMLSSVLRSKQLR